MNNEGKQIKTGMLLSYLNIFIGSIIPIVYTPLMLEMLGKSEYGLYKIAAETTGSLSLISLGFGASISRFIIKAKVEGGQDDEEKLLGLFCLIFNFLAIVALIIGAIISFNLDIVYGNSLTENELFRMTIIVIFMTITTALNFSSTPLTAVASAHEQFIFIQSINVISTIGIPIANLVAFYLGYKSISMAIISLGASIITRLAYNFYIYRKLKIKPNYKKPPLHLLKEIWSFSFWVFIANIVSKLNTSADTIIIGATPALSTSGAAIYGVGYAFVNIVFSLSQVMPGFFSPKVNRIVFSNEDSQKLDNLMIRVGRLQCFLLAFICSGFIAFGQPFITFYADESYMNAYWVAAIILVPNCIPLMQSVALSVIQAKNMHRFRSIIYVFIAMFNVLFTIILINKYGIIGAAVPTAITYIIGHGLIMNWYYWKKVGLNIPLFWKKMLPCILLSATMCTVTLFSYKFINYYNIVTMLIGIIIYTLIYILASFKFILNDEEKGFVVNIFKRKNIKES